MTAFKARSTRPGGRPEAPGSPAAKLLWRADWLLRHCELLKPLRDAFGRKIGRPTVPMERYVRLMFLRDQEGWGYEKLVAEVAARPHLRRFCRIPSDDGVPHSTTLIKLTNRFGKARLGDLLQVIRGRLGLVAGGERCSA